jgi:putative PIN family toxin of toxin-antitoxin system
MRNTKVILDTNLWISFLISKRLEYLDDYLLNGKIKLMFSKESIEEFLIVSKKPKLNQYFSQDDINDLLRLFTKYGKLVVVTSNIKKCRDFKDNFLLNLAIDSKANYLVTGDLDLLVIKTIEKTKILNWTEFTEIIK